VARDGSIQDGIPDDAAGVSVSCVGCGSGVEYIAV
jgi:hypothetical protein